MRTRVALAVLVLSVATTSALAESLTGVVSDAMCAKDPVAASKPDHAACAAKCMKGGSPAVLIVGDKVYKVSNPAKLVPFAGQKVTVDGTVTHDTLTVASVKP